jgi:integrase
LRVRVPDDLVAVLDQREIWKSLGTGNHGDAKRLYLDERAKMERKLARAREGLGALSEDEIKAMVVDWFRRIDRAMTEADFKARGTARQEALENAIVDEDTLINGDKVENMRSVQCVADAILIENDWPGKPHRVGKIETRALVAVVDKTSEQYAMLCDHVDSAMVEVCRRQQDRLKGNPAGRSFDPMFADGSAGTAPVVRNATARLGNAPCLTEIFEKWKAERKPPAKTVHEWSTAVRRFVEVNGDMPVDAITRGHVREFKDALLQLPAVPPPKVRALKVPQIIAAMSGKDVAWLAAGTVNKQLTAVRALLSWCRKNGYVDANVAAELTVPTAKNAGPSRLPYGVDDMNLIFGSLEQFRKRKPSRFWIPLMAAFTGARMEELGQLTVSDVRSRDGIDYIDINAVDEGKSIKTGSSAREVPLHPLLIKLGFLGHVQERKGRGDRSLFPDLKPDKLGKLTGNFSKWWTRHTRGLGIADHRKVFHSFRHGFKDACRAARITEEVHDALTGHAGGGVGRTYGGGVPLDVKATEIAKVRYEGLDPSHLHVG